MLRTLLVEAIGDGSRGGLVDDPHHIHARNHACDMQDKPVSCQAGGHARLRTCTSLADIVPTKPLYLMYQNGAVPAYHTYTAGTDAAGSRRAQTDILS